MPIRKGWTSISVHEDVRTSINSAIARMIGELGMRINQSQALYILAYMYEHSVDVRTAAIRLGILKPANSIGENN